MFVVSSLIFFACVLRFLSHLFFGVNGTLSFFQPFSNWRASVCVCVCVYLLTGDSLLLYSCGVEPPISFSIARFPIFGSGDFATKHGNILISYPLVPSLLSPISFIFMQFSAKIWPNNRLTPLPMWLAPHLGNPRTATCLVHYWFTRNISPQGLLSRFLSSDILRSLPSHTCKNCFQKKLWNSSKWSEWTWCYLPVILRLLSNSFILSWAGVAGMIGRLLQFCLPASLRSSIPLSLQQSNTCHHGGCTGRMHLWCSIIHLNFNFIQVLFYRKVHIKVELKAFLHILILSRV